MVESIEPATQIVPDQMTDASFSQEELDALEYCVWLADQIREDLYLVTFTDPAYESLAAIVSRFPSSIFGTRSEMIFEIHLIGENIMTFINKRGVDDLRAHFLHSNDIFDYIFTLAEKSLQFGLVCTDQIQAA